MPGDNTETKTLIRLNPALDALALKKEFAQKQRIHIPKILTEDSAERVYRSLAKEVDWHLVFNEGHKVHTLYPEQVKAMTEDHKQKVRQIVISQAQKGFQFLYNNYNIYDYYLNGKNTDHLLHRFHEFLNSNVFLDFVRTLSGFETITFADSQATAYGPGHFLTMHHDEVPGKDRKMAYVFNFTPNWQMDWGGLLLFLGPDGNINGGFVPAFNALNMFAVPQDHAVSYVAPFAPAIRYSITGWLRESDDSTSFRKASKS